MSQPELKRAKENFKKVRAILNEDWDPIPGTPEDEYDAYVWPLVRLLTESSQRSNVEIYLREAARAMETPVPDKRINTVLDKLMALEV